MNLIFDLDGTLTDPEDGIVACIRYALEGLGRPERGEGDLTWCIGPPLRGSFASLLDDDDPVLVEEAVVLYRERFATKGLYENRVYDGIPELLARMTDAGHVLFLATSKVRVYAVEILRHFGLDIHFRSVYGAEMDGRLGEKPELLAHLLETEKIRPTESVMIGDRRHDIVGAQANDVPAIGVLYGYGSEEELRDNNADYLCRSPAEIAAVVADLS